MNTLAQRLKQARSETGLSQAALAKLAGIGQSTLASIENGRNHSSAKLVEIAAVLRLTVEWLATGKGPKRPPDTTANTPAFLDDDGPSEPPPFLRMPDDWPLPAIPKERIEALAKDPVKLERLQGAIGLALAQIERGALAAPDQRSSSGAVHSLDDVTLPFDSDPNGIGQLKATTADEALSIRRISRAKDVVVNVAPGVAAANDKIEGVPELGDVRLAAGDGIENHDEHVTGTVKFRRSFLRSVGADGGRGRVVYAKGDSMEPVIPDGSTLLFVLRPDMTIKDIATNSIYAINYDGKMVVKIVTQDRSGRWVARSANPAHADIDLESGVPVRLLGRVVWVGFKL